MDLLRAGRSARFTATGHSMTPTIRSGDEVTVVPLQPTDPAIGAVLACDMDGRLVVHRLVRRSRGRALVRGDVAPDCDPPLAPRAVLGVVHGIERRGRSVRFGLGRERFAIAWLSRHGLLRASAVLIERIRRALAKGRREGSAGPAAAPRSSSG